MLIGDAGPMGMKGIVALPGSPGGPNGIVGCCRWSVLLPALTSSQDPSIRTFWAGAGGVIVSLGVLLLKYTPLGLIPSKSPNGPAPAYEVNAAFAEGAELPPVVCGHSARKCSSLPQVEHFMTKPSRPIGLPRRPFPLPEERRFPLDLPFPP